MPLCPSPDGAQPAEVGSGFYDLHAGMRSYLHGLATEERLCTAGQGLRAGFLLPCMPLRSQAAVQQAQGSNTTVFAFGTDRNIEALCAVNRAMQSRLVTEVYNSLSECSLHS